MALDYIEDKELAGDIAGDITQTTKNAIVATGIDLVSTLYNSTVGLVADDISTRDMLQKVDENALAFYDQHKDGVETASFMAGLIAPQVVTLKLLGMAKNGVSALGKTNYLMNTFSGKKATMLETELRTMFTNAQHDTTLYKQTMNQLYRAKISENLIDSAIFEAVALGTLNAHPYMEDYMETPYTSFAMWAGLGGAVGSVFGVIAALRAVRGATSEIATKATASVMAGFDVPSPVAANAEKFQSYAVSVKNKQNIIDTGKNEFTKQLGRDAQLHLQARREETLLAAAPWLVQGGKPSEHAALKPFVEQLMADPRMFGVDKIKLPNMNFTPKKQGSSIDIDVIDPFVKAATDDTKASVATVFYRPSTGEIFDRNLAGNAALAVDLKDFKLNIKTVNLQNPGADWSINNLARSKPSAAADGDFLNELAAWVKVKPSDVQHIVIAPDNLARQGAAVAWLSKQDPDVVAALRFNLRSDMASFAQTEKFLESGAAGVKPSYADDVVIIANNPKNHLMTKLGESDGSRLLSNWKGGNLAPLRRAFDRFFRGTSLPANEAGNELIASKIWEAGQAFRNEMKTIADADGYVYLYRGIRGNVKGHAPIEGYTTKPNIANKFGTARLFKVHTDNIVGRIGGSGYATEAEILVASPHNTIVNNLPIETAANAPVKIANAASTNQISGVDLAQHYREQTAIQVNEMVKAGEYSFEEISARLNINKDAAMLVASGRDIAEIPNWQRYSDPELIATEYLNKKNRILALQGNPNVTNPAIMAANLDDRFWTTANQQMVEFITSKHHSSIADDLRSVYGAADDLGEQKVMHGLIDHLKQNLGEINNQVVKSPFAQSVDNALRRLQDSPIITHIGKQIVDKMDKAVERIIGPVGLAMKSMRNNQAGLLDFNQGVNKLYSLRGWRDLVVEEETGYGYFIQREKRGTQLVAVPVKNADGSTFYIKDPSALSALESTRAASNEVLRLHQLNRELTAASPINDLGFYLPPPSLVNKFYSYVEDIASGEIRTLIANSADELAQLESAFRTEIISKNPKLKIVTKGQQEDYNLIKGYGEAEAYTTYANNQLRHGGSISQAIVPTDDRFVTSIMQGYEQQIIGGSRKWNELYLHDIIGKLDMLSDINQKLFRNQPQKGFAKQQGPDAAKTVKNALLGINNLNQFSTWKSLNEYTDMAIIRTTKAVDAVIGTFGKNVTSAESFEQLNQVLKERGINNAWESLQLFQAAQLGAPNVMPRRVVAAANGLLGTFQLRFMELAHPLVNALSLPILSSAALKEGLPGTLMPNGEVIKFPARIIYDAARFQFNPEGKRIMKIWEEEGLISPAVRKSQELIAVTHVPVSNRGAVANALGAVERMQESGAMSMFTKPADYVETFTRQFGMAQGYLMAKHAYPGISDKAATIYAMSITDRVIGNYHSAQRPAMFQGSLGVALGLYQTYMLSFAQHVYRGIERRQWNALSTSMLAQAGIFGTASLPGYDTLSKFIGLHMSQENYDLTTGTYRALGDPMAEVVLYGLPANISRTSLYTRGDVQPRIPSQVGDLAIVNTMMGVYNATSKAIGSLVKQPGIEGKLQGMMEGLSLQTLSRPLARTAEIIAGESITSKGQTVSTSDDVWTFNGITSRLLSVRPMEEQITRQALHLNSFYGAADYENRQKAVGKLRTAIRAGTMDDELIETVATEYFRAGGKNGGWTSVMNEIMTRTEEGTSYDLMKKLEPNSPLRLMLKDTF